MRIAFNAANITQRPQNSALSDSKAGKLAFGNKYRSIVVSFPEELPCVMPPLNSFLRKFDKSRSVTISAGQTSVSKGLNMISRVFTSSNGKELSKIEKTLKSLGLKTGKMQNFETIV